LPAFGNIESLDDVVERKGVGDQMVGFDSPGRLDVAMVRSTRKRATAISKRTRLCWEISTLRAPQSGKLRVDFPSRTAARHQDNVGLAYHNHPLDVIAQLPDVARPIV
jgi:hypothetical protein